MGVGQNFRELRSFNNMKWILLPGFDGTGILFAPLLRSLPEGIEPVVVAYPADRTCSAEELVEIVAARLPKSEPCVLIAESFSGPIALKAAAQPQTPPAAVVLCASFVQCPVPRVLIGILRFCGIAFGGTRPPRWLVRRYLLGDAEEAVFALFYRAIGEVTARALAERLSVLLEFDEDFAPMTLKCPLLYLQAGKDRLVAAHHFEIVRRRYPATQLEKIESPHLILQVQPQASVRAILQFLSAVRSANQKSLFPGGGFVV
jgi:pimeloyl-ACP methyl ester carboxylesterase